MKTVESQHNLPTIRFSLRTLLVYVSVFSILCFIGACIHWVIPIELSAIAVSVALLATVTARGSATLARITTTTAKIIGVGVNLINLIQGTLGGMIGLAHGTDTSADFNNRLALVGFSCATVAIVNCLTLWVSQRMFFQGLLPIAAVGNCITLALATLAFVYPRLDVIGGVKCSVIFYSLTFISVNAIAVRLTYLLRFSEEMRMGRLKRKATKC